MGKIDPRAMWQERAKYLAVMADILAVFGGLVAANALRTISTTAWQISLASVLVALAYICLTVACVVKSDQSGWSITGMVLVGIAAAILDQMEGDDQAFWSGLFVLSVGMTLKHSEGSAGWWR